MNGILPLVDNFQHFRNGRAVIGICQSDNGIALQDIFPPPAAGHMTEFLFKLTVGKLQERQEFWMRKVGVNLCRQRIVQAFIVRAANLADITAIDDSLNLLAKFQIHDALVLSLKGQTALGIHAAIANQAGSRTGCHAAIAVSASVVDGLIGLDVQIGDELS